MEHRWTDEVPQPTELQPDLDPRQAAFRLLCEVASESSVEIDLLNSGRFPHHPTGRESLEARSGLNQRTFVMQRVAQNPHDCAVETCYEPIERGDKYVVVHVIQEKRAGEDHWHVHHDCFQERVIDVLQDVRAIPAKRTTPQNLYAKRRRHIKNRRMRGISPVE